VENFTFLCVHSKEMSNQARKACTSKGRGVSEEGRLLGVRLILTIVSRASQGEGRLECEVFLFRGKQVNVLKQR
jgi:hypothetical protein